MLDLIERDEAIKRIQPRFKTKTMYGEGYIDAIEHATEILSLIPSANLWIPCSVKKPEAHKSVLVVIKDNDRYTWINIGETGEDGNWMIGGEFWYSKSDTSITHWMPLPEPPKGV